MSRPAGFEPTISASERPQTQDLDGAVTGTGRIGVYGVLVRRDYSREVETQAVVKFFMQNEILSFRIKTKCTICQCKFALKFKTVSPIDITWRKLIMSKHFVETFSGNCLYSSSLVLL